MDDDGLLGGPVTSTVSAGYSCSPDSDVAPFVTQMSVTLTSNYPWQTRRMAGSIRIRLANDPSISNWRRGYTNVAPLDSHVTFRGQNIPALGALAGTSMFTLQVDDVTPAPFNQPPYAPSGDQDFSTCIHTVTTR